MACVALDDKYRTDYHDLGEIPEGERYAGARMRFIRRKSSHSIDSFAEEIGAKPSTLQEWETKPGSLKKRRHGEYVAKAAEVLRVAESTIWYGPKSAPQLPETVVEELSAFLARAASRSDVPGDIRSRAKGLLAQVMGFGESEPENESETA